MSREDVSWERALFDVVDDLEGRAEAAFAAEREAELADRSRAEYLQVTLASRLMAELDRELSLEVVGVGRLEGRVERVATGWLLLATTGGEWIVRQGALVSIRGVGERGVPEVAWPVTARLGLASALRRLADDECYCVLHAIDGTRLEGTPRRVGQDFVEVAVGDAGELGLMPLGVLAAVRRTPAIGVGGRAAGI